MNRLEARDGANRLKDARIAAVAKRDPLDPSAYAVRIWLAAEEGAQEHFFRSPGEIESYIASKRFRERVGKQYPPGAKFSCDTCGRDDLSEVDADVCAAFRDLRQMCPNLRFAYANEYIRELEHEKLATSRLLHFPAPANHE